MRKFVLALTLSLAACGSTAPTISHADMIRALKWVCSAVQNVPDPAPTSGGAQ